MKFFRNSAGKTGRHMIRNETSSDEVGIQNLFLETGEK
jgi:hypothetical protein